MKGEMVPGSIRNGSGLLTGLLRCGHCGRKLNVHRRPDGRAQYACHNANVDHGRKKRISLGNLRIDAAVSAEVLALIAPLGLDAAPQAIAGRDRTGTQRLHQIELLLEQACCEAARAHRQYDAVDPLCDVGKNVAAGAFFLEIAPLMAVWRHISSLVFLDLLASSHKLEAQQCSTDYSLRRGR